MVLFEQTERVHQSLTRNTLPTPRVSLGVHAGDDDDRVTVAAVEETVRKALGDENAPGVTMQNGIGFWRFENALSRRTERG